MYPLNLRCSIRSSKEIRWASLNELNASLAASACLTSSYLIQKRRLFWIRYEDVRQALAASEAFNSFNDAQRISFEDLMLQRRFSGYIVAESNVYDDRSINQYKMGSSQIFEAERIKNEIFNFEQDLWEY